MSKASKKRRRATKRDAFPWLVKKRETPLAAFARQASDLARQDQKNLVERGWTKLEAAIEAWLTQDAL